MCAKESVLSRFGRRKTKSAQASASKGRLARNGKAGNGIRLAGIETARIACRHKYIAQYRTEDKRIFLLHSACTGEAQKRPSRLLTCTAALARLLLPFLPFCHLASLSDESLKKFECENPDGYPPVIPGPLP